MILPLRHRAPCLVGLLAALLALSACSDGEPEIQNVVLISIDTLRYDHLGLAGYPRDVSPHLDELGRTGVVFEQAIAQAPWTAPSHASMLTSLYPSVLNMGTFSRPGRVSDRAETLAEVLRANGYRTRAVVAGGFLDPQIGLDQGFEQYDARGLNMELTVDRAIEWLESEDASAPFFLFLHTYDVHKYFPPPSYRERFVRPYSGSLPTDRKLAEIVQSNDHQEMVRGLGEEDRRYVRDVYDASIAAVDDQVRRLTAFLDEAGLRDQTLLVITSDHGEEFWEHGRTGHGYSLFDENLRVPLLLNHASLDPRRVPEQVRLLDVAPTVLDLVGIDPPPYWQGVRLTSFLAGRPRPLLAFSEHAHLPFKSVRTDHYKYVLSLRRPKQLLFDLEEDGPEGSNLARTGLEVETSMREALRRWIATNGREARFQGDEAVELGEDVLKQLRELGYLSTDGTADPKPGESDWSAALDDPMPFAPKKDQ